MRLHPDFEPLRGLPPLDLSALDAARAGMAAGAAARTPRPPGTLVIEDRTIAGPGGALRLRLYRPTRTGLLPALVYFHGGGFVLGDLDTEHDRCVDYAQQVGCLVVSVDYRLAPEHPFPAASDDALAALTWLSDEAENLGADRERIAVGGGSAGAALAAGLALRVRDAGGPRIAFVLLVQPGLDHLQTQPSARTFTDTPFLKAADLPPTWRAYLGATPPTGAPLAWAAPFAAESLSGFPPACILIGAVDPVRDEGLAFARRLITDGAEVELHLLAGTPHGFDMIEDAQITRDALMVRVAALTRAFQRAAPAKPVAGKGTARGVLAAAAIGMALSILPIFAGTFPVFLGALNAAASPVAGLFPSLLLVAALVGSACNLASGWAVDRFGPRRVVLPGVVLFGASIAGLSLADRVGSGVFILAALVGAASSLTGPVAYAKAVSGWFEARRGAALGLAVTAVPMLSMALMAPLAAALIDHLGWRGAYLAIGAGVAVLGLVILAAWFRDPPIPADGDAPDLTGPAFGASFGQALGSATFWQVTIAVALGGAVASAVSGQMLVIAAGLGVDRGVAVIALSALAAAGLAGAMAAGVIVDRLASPRIVAVGFLLALAGVALLRLGAGPGAFVAGCVLLGAGNFAAGSALPYMIGRFFGLRRMGEIFGACAALVAILSATGPMLFAVAVAAGVSIATVFNVGMVVLAAAALLLLPIRRYPESFETRPSA